jgi:hypothetical protein
MPADPSRPQRPSWRDQAKAGDRKVEAQKAWRKEPAVPAGTPKRPIARKAKLAGVFLAMAAVVGGIIAVILWLWPAKPIYVVLIGAGYEQNLAIPHNVYGMEGLNGIEELFKDKEKLARLDRFQQPTSWQRAIQEFKSGGKEKTIVLYFAMHGGADSNGPYLLFNNKAPEKDDKSLLRIDQLLKELERLPGDKKKLLILDATQISHCPRLMVANEFSRKLKELNSAIKKIDNLVVLNASDDNQRSWTSDEWRQSAFGHYLQEGLKGGADNGKGRVTALTLFKFVRDKVERWAYDNRFAAQTPLLLPQGNDGEARADSMELALVEDSYSPTAPPSPPRSLPKEWEQRWKEKEDLAGLVPAPAVYSPHLWTQYLKTLLRYEQLVRAGASGAASDLGKDLDRLRNDIAKSKRLGARQLKEPISARNALAVPSAYGLLDKPLLQDADGLFRKLWAAKPDKWKAVWRDDVQSKVGSDGAKMLPLRLCEWLLVNKTENLDQACEMIRVLVDMKDRPVEAQEMVTWQADLTDLFGKAGKELAGLPLALQTRRQAERAALGVPETRPGKPLAHPFSEFVRPWIEAEINAGDTARRTGQDLLFSGQEEDKTRSQNMLSEAGKHYLKALSIAATVQLALNTRAEAMSSLPFYADWLALRRPADDRALAGVEDYAVLLTKVEELWGSVHSLNALLAARPSAAQLETKVAQLKREAQLLGDGLGSISSIFAEDCKKIRKKDTQTDWHALDGLLTVPFIDRERRSELVKAFGEVSYGLNNGNYQEDKNKGGRKKAAEGPSASETEKAAQKNAERLARMTLARLGAGAELFPSPAGPNRMTYDEVKKLAGKLLDDKWQDHALEFGEQAGLRWRGMAAKIIDLAEKSQKKTDLGEAEQEMIVADRLCRQIDAAGAAQLHDLRADLDPVDENRRLHAHDLLIWMADRALNDRWIGEDIKRPYYKDMGGKYVRDARDMAGVKDMDAQDPSLKRGREKAATAKEKELAQPLQLVFEWSANGGEFKKSEVDFHVTSEKEYNLDFQLAAEGLPTGYPVVYVNPGKIKAADAKKLEALKCPQPLSLAAKERAPLSLGRVQNPHYDDLFNTRAKPIAETAGQPQDPAVVHGLFRGYRVPAMKAAVQFHGRANTIVYQNPLPETGAVLIFADEKMHERYSPRKGAVYILVDLSGSMRWGHESNPKNDKPAEGEESRYQQATGALKRIMNESFTNGLEAQLWTFSGDPGTLTKDETRGQVVVNGKPYPFGMIAKSDRWKKGDADGFLKRLAKYKPEGGTPLIESMRLVKKALLKSKRPTKTLIVLTDGGDDDSEATAAQRVQAAFAGSNVAVHLVGFHLDSKETPKFDEIAKGIGNLEPPGRAYYATKVEEVVAALRNALQWNYTLVRPTEKKPTDFRERDRDRVQEIDYPDQLNYWRDKLTSNSSYEVLLQRPSWDERLHKVYVGAGELRIYKLTEERPREYKLRPTLLTEVSAYNQLMPLQKREEGWQTTVFSDFQIEEGQRLRTFLAAIENTRVDALEDAVPEQVWLELEAPDKTVVQGVRWGNQLGYPAPVWRVEAVEPRDRKKAQELMENVRFTAWIRHKAWDGELIPRKDWFKSGGINLPGTRDVHIDSVNTEDFYRVDAKGRRDKSEKKMHCVVVRLSYPKGKPVFAQPYSEALAKVKRGFGYEHHFYADVGGGRGKYTGIFWYGGDDVLESVTDLRLTAVEGLKTDGLTRKIEMDLGKAGPEGPEAQRFLPQLGLK